MFMYCLTAHFTLRLIVRFSETVKYTHLCMYLPMNLPQREVAGQQEATSWGLEATLK